MRHGLRALLVLLLLYASAASGGGGGGGGSGGGSRRNIFAFHDTYKPGGKGYDGAWEFYPWDRIQTVGVFGDHNPELVSKAAQEGAKFAVSNDPSAVIDPETTNATMRSAWVKAAVAAAQAVNATAINIDHEATMMEGSTQSALLSAVMAELGTALRKTIPGAQLSFDAAARPCYEHRCYNYSAIAGAVDWMFVMDYDLNDFDDPPPDNDHSRANAPLPTVEAGLKRLIAAGVPPEKIVCGLPWYGYIYLLNKKGTVLVSCAIADLTGILAVRLLHPFLRLVHRLNETAAGQRRGGILENRAAAVERVLDIALGRGFPNAVPGGHNRRGRLA